MKEKFNDKINENEIEKWKNGDKVILNGGTGTGKTLFTMTRLASYVKAKTNKTIKISDRKKILYVCNRTKLEDDVELDILKFNNSDVIDVTTYQSIQQNIIRKIPIKEYDYYVFDEIHYFISDAAFNKHTDISYQFAISRKNSISIFMSATADELFTKIKTNSEKYYEYKIEKDYSYVEKMYFLHGKDCMKSKIVDIMNTTNDKIIYFCNSSDNAFNLHKELSDKSNFYCSKSNKYKKYSQPDCIKKYKIGEIDNITFEKQLLITTVALDNGINLVDRNIKHILCDVFDTDKLIQCFGRKRIIDDTDTCNFYLKKYSNREISGFEKNINDNLKPAKLFRKDIKEFNIKYVNNRNFPQNIIYPEVDENGKEYFKLNELQYAKGIIDLANIRRMKEIGYKKFIYSKFGTTLKRTNVIDAEVEEQNCKQLELKEYLDSIVGEVMLKLPDRRNLIEKLNIRSDGKLLKKKQSLNAALEELNLPFRVTEFETSRIIDGKKKNFKSAWKVQRLTED